MRNRFVMQMVYDCDASDLLASPWAPFPIFCEAEDAWHVLFVSYMCDGTWFVAVGVSGPGACHFVWCARFAERCLGCAMLCREAIFLEHGLLSRARKALLDLTRRMGLSLARTQAIQLTAGVTFPTHRDST